MNILLALFVWTVGDVVGLLVLALVLFAGFVYFLCRAIVWCWRRLFPKPSTKLKNFKFL